MQGELYASVVVNGGTYTLALRGEIDLDTQSDLSELLAHAVDTAQRILELDLAQLRSLSARGADRIREAAGAAGLKGVHFRIVRTSDDARRTLYLRGMTDLLY